MTWNDADKPLSGKKIAVLVENKFIPEEIDAYRNAFSLLGAKVDLVSRLWYGSFKPTEDPVFYSDVDPGDNAPWESPHRLTVPKGNDVSAIKPSDYDAVIMAANYTSVRLRWEDVPQGNGPVDARTYVQSPPVVQFFAAAMKDRNVIKGALCHGLWILTPFPELLAKRKVTCHTVVMADILNCGAEVVFDKNEKGENQVAKVVTDGDLVTGYSKHEALLLAEAVTRAIQATQTTAPAKIMQPV